MRVAIESTESLEQIHRDPESVTHAGIAGFQPLSLEVLAECRNLESLLIVGVYHSGADPDWCDTIDDFSILRTLPALRTLAIHDCRHFDETQLAIIADIPTLRSLSITTFKERIKQYDVLRNNPDLTILQLTCVSDLSFLGALPNLEHLFVSDKWASEPLRNLHTLSSLSRLQSLSIHSHRHKSVSISAACPVQLNNIQDGSWERSWWKQLTEAV